VTLITVSLHDACVRASRGEDENFGPRVSRVCRLPIKRQASSVAFFSFVGLAAGFGSRFVGFKGSLRLEMRWRLLADKTVGALPTRASDRNAPRL